MSTQIFESKTPAENLVLTFDFAEGLGVGELLFGTPAVVASVVYGTDAAPSGVLNGAASISPNGLDVMVPVHAGLAGVDYQLFVTCPTTNPLKTLTLAAVLPVRAASDTIDLPLTLFDLRARFRTTSDDRKAPYRWADADLNAYINEAQIEACWRASLIIDSTVPSAAPIDQVTGARMTVVPLIPNRSTYDLDSKIIFLRRARLLSAPSHLPPAEYSDLDRTDRAWATRSGAVERFVTGLDSPGRLKLRLYRAPAAFDTAALTVVREPLEALAADGDYPEIGARYHLKLLDWAAYRAYSNFDADTYNPELAAVHLKRFEDVFGTREANIAREAALLASTSNRFEYATGVW
jgi:hypothetical protein